ncbi:hypothetical protein ACJ41O_009898 [Fusarium nematophilum]
MAAKKPSAKWWLWTKVLIGGAVVAVGGPAFTMWLTPTEEELRSRYNPELRKKSLENREEKQQEFDDFVTRLKEYSKSDKPSDGEGGRGAKEKGGRCFGQGITEGD